MANQWYIQLLSADRGAEVSRHDPVTFSFTETVNEKKQINFTVPYSAEFDFDKWFYLRNDRENNPWFYGRVDSVSNSYVTNQGRVTRVSGFCNLEKLSEIQVGTLGLFDFGYRSPDMIRIIDNTGENPAGSIDEAQTVPFTWSVSASSGYQFGKNAGTNALYVGSDVPFTDVDFQMSAGIPASNTYLRNAFFFFQQLNNENGWDITPSNDTTDAFLQSGLISPATDPAGQWITNSQSGQEKFWRRFWLQQFSEAGQLSSDVDFTNITINKRIPTPTAITKMMTVLPGWTVESSTTADDIYHEFRGGETALEAFRLISRMTGGFFVNGSLAADRVGWYPATVSNLVAAASAPKTITYDIALPGSGVKIQLKTIATKRIMAEATRVTVYGAGFGQQRLTPKLQDIYTVGTPSGDGFVYSFSVAGINYSYNTDTNLLIDLTAEAALGRSIHRELNIPYTSSLYASGESIEASNQLLTMSVRYLQKAAKLDRVAYTVSAMNMTEPVEVGKTVRLIYDDGDVSIDDAFIVTKASYAYQSSGFAGTFELSADGFFLDSTIGAYQDSRTLTRHRTTYPQPINSINVAGARSTGGDSGIAAGDFTFDAVTNPETPLGSNFSGDVILRRLKLGTAGLPVSTLDIQPGNGAPAFRALADNGNAQVQAFPTATGGVFRISGTANNTLSEFLSGVGGGAFRINQSDGVARAGAAVNGDTNIVFYARKPDGKTAVQFGAGTVLNGFVRTYSGLTNGQLRTTLETSSDDEGKIGLWGPDGVVQFEAIAKNNATSKTFLRVGNLPTNEPNFANQVWNDNGNLVLSGHTGTTAGTDLGYIEASRTVTSSTGNDTILPIATTTIHGLFSPANVTKLNGIQAGAQVNLPTNLAYDPNTQALSSSTGADVVIPTATTALAGLFSAAEKVKLAGIQAGAQANVGTDLGYVASSRQVTSSTGNNTTIPNATTSNSGLMTAANLSKLNGIQVGAQQNVGTNLAYNPTSQFLSSSTGAGVVIPSVSTTDEGLMWPTDKVKLNGIEAGAQANVGTNLGYVASSRQVTSSTGNNTTIPNATTSNSGLMSPADKSKLDNILFGGNAPGWVTPTITLGNGWSQSPTNPIRYRKNATGDMLLFEGWMVRSGQTDIPALATIFTIAAVGDRPSRQQPLATYEIRTVPGTSAVEYENGSAFVQPTGAVRVWNSNSNIDLWWLSGAIPLV